MNGTLGWRKTLLHLQQSFVLPAAGPGGGRNPLTTAGGTWVSARGLGFLLLPTRFCWHRRRMAAPDIDVQKIAHLARLRLTPHEAQRFGEQLGSVIGYMSKLSELDVTGVDATAHAMPLVNVTRPDEVRPSLPPPEVLRNAPAHVNGLFTVPKIVE